MIRILATLLRTFAFLLIALPLGAQVASQPTVRSMGSPILSLAGRRFRDLNRNGTLESYEDWRLPSVARAADLVRRMTLAEKAGAAVHGTAPMAGGMMAAGPAYDSAATAQLLARHVTSLITRMSMAPAIFAAENNRLQAMAERGRLGIPITISTDPRNHFQVLAGASVAASGFSQWPEPLGLGALHDPALV